MADLHSTASFRAVAFAELEQVCPELVPFLAQLYDRRNAYAMRVGGAEPHTVWADHGWDQGDPFGPIGYALGEHRALATARDRVRAHLQSAGAPMETVERCQVWAYLGDVILAVPCLLYTSPSPRD